MLEVGGDLCQVPAKFEPWVQKCMKFTLIELLRPTGRTQRKNFDKSIARLEFHVKYFHTLKHLQ